MLRCPPRTWAPLSSSGRSATKASVVSISEAIEPALVRAVRTTFVGSSTPAFTRSPNSPVSPWGLRCPATSPCGDRRTRVLLRPKPAVSGAACLRRESPELLPPARDLDSSHQRDSSRENEPANFSTFLKIRCSGEPHTVPWLFPLLREGQEMNKDFGYGKPNRNRCSEIWLKARIDNTGSYTA